jgi:hypothetical protein
VQPHEGSTQRRILLAIAEGQATLARVFEHVREAERRPFPAGAPCVANLRELAECAAPLLQIGDPGRPFPQRSPWLAAKADHVRLSAPAGRPGWAGWPR